MSSLKTLLGGLSVEQFFSDYWQKKPLLIRGAFPAFKDPISAEELAGLACEEEVVSRLVLEKGGERPWELRRGPFKEQDFLTLPDSHWTLLISDVEKHLPELAQLLEPFRFIPDWRVDDLQISYAPEHGTVGPHWDDYDVFLLQGQGRRHWRISYAQVAEDNYLEGVDLRIMRDFQIDQEWTLEPGDMLYLPPLIAHYGTALEPCLTYSIGFRALTHRELVHSFFDFLSETLDEQGRYRDPDLQTQDHPGCISDQAVAKVQDILRQYIASDHSLVQSWFGRFVTEPKPHVAAQPMEEPWDELELREFVHNGGTLERNPGSRFAFAESDDALLLFVDGQEMALGNKLAPLALLLCQERSYPPNKLRSWLKLADASALLLDLLNDGYLVSYDDDSDD